MVDDPTLGVKPGENPTPAATAPVVEPTPKEGVPAPEEVPTEPVLKPEEGEEPVPRRRKTAADRIGELIQRNRQLEQILAGRTPGVTPASGVPTEVPSEAGEYAPQIQQIVENLRNLGFVRSEDVNRQIDLLEARLILESEHSRLEKAYDGSDGRPKYNREKIGTYAYERGIYDLETAYKSLNEPELMDWAIKQARTEAGKTPSMERPAKSARAGAEAISREAIARIVATPEGRAWYEKNRDKILALLQKGEL